MMIDNNEPIEKIKKFFDDCMTKNYVKKSIKEICIVEKNYKDWFLYKKIFEENNIQYYLQYKYGI